MMSRTLSRYWRWNSKYFCSRRIPHRCVQRIKEPVRDYGPGRELVPMNAVGRLIRDKSALSASDRFVLFVRFAIWILVDKWRQVVRRGARIHDDVVVLGTVKLEDSQIGPGPVNAVAAFCVAESFGMIRLFVDFVPTAAAIVHAVHIAIFDNRVIGRSATFPGRIVDEHNFALAGLLQLECCARLRSRSNNRRRTVHGAHRCGLDQQPEQSQWLEMPIPR